MRKQKVDELASGGETLEGTAGEDIDDEQVAWYDETADEWFLVENGTPPFVGLWGVVIDGATAGKKITIHYRGLESFVSPGNFAAGTAIYADSATSVLTTTATGNEQIGVAKTEGVTGEDFVLDVNNATSGGTGAGVEETLASNGRQYRNTIGTTSVEIDWTTECIGFDVYNDSNGNDIAVRFDQTDAAIPSNGSSLSDNNTIHSKESRYFPVKSQYVNIIASASSTQVRVTGFDPE